MSDWVSMGMADTRSATTAMCGDIGGFASGEGKTGGGEHFATARFVEGRNYRKPRTLQGFGIWLTGTSIRVGSLALIDSLSALARPSAVSVRRPVMPKASASFR